MKKNLKVGLYDPYFDTLGGGEKHILQIMKALEDFGCQINIFWDKDLRQEIIDRFSKLYSFLPAGRQGKSLEFLPNIFKNKSFLLSTVKTLRTLKTFDYFFYIPDGSYFFSSAKKNFVFAMVPNKKLYPHTVLSKLKTNNYQFVANSKFTQSWLKKWSIDSTVVYPYVDHYLLNLNINQLRKEKIILSLGRFFRHLHAKNQDMIINLFKKLKQKSSLLKDFKLILAGGLKEEDKDYFDRLKELAGDDPSIIFKPNIPLYELYELYKLSAVFWHFTGYGIDENEHPEQVEHLGIAPLEAMAAGCLTFCYNAGGPKEIVRHNDTGFLFSSEEEIINKMGQIITNLDLQQKIRLRAQKFINDNFSYNKFAQRIKDLIL